ncbi:Serine/threonine-protein kinase PknB [Rubripirellula lacrimiformis]|uniref:Serine/threonine-protein kinase PknB n=1 Tax=Rubripirellula lacrimiformis TaxID=1930273 RepID=A0A517NEJ8_9BACT|nr:Hsp70 family protein [Rubripirellula lacrimiformis]QDT05553.1 Serine/threonine-protein kinase PknB [Rubripirellula lacrimiformis]
MSSEEHQSFGEKTSLGAKPSKPLSDGMSLPGQDSPAPGSSEPDSPASDSPASDSPAPGAADQDVSSSEDLSSVANLSSIDGDPTIENFESSDQGSSSSENLPITDEPTRAFGSFMADSDSLDFSMASSPQVDDDVPKQIGGYVIQKLIGSGGMGNVYLAEHTRMQRLVAIKMLPIKRMKEVTAVQRFYAEVLAASRLMHPNIVTAFDAGESEQGIHYLAMEFVDGMTLTRWVATRGPLGVGEAAAIIRQAALGLLHAHRAGIIHRDVKPGNLMRASDGTIKVLDLGLARINAAEYYSPSGKASAKESAEPSSKGRLVGTLPFMSPEQLEDPDQADARSDIYSLGATMYFLLTASPPFTGEYLDQVYGHRHGEIPDLMQARGDVDLRFAHIFSRMMAKKPDERYASLDEVIDDLGQYANQVDAPVWMTEFANRIANHDSSTFGGGSTQSGGSTSGASSKVFAIDYGMFYSATAAASPLGGVNPLPAGGDDRPLFRMAIASDEDRLIFGQDAIQRRSESPKSLVHCLPMYIGKPLMDRKVIGRSCPPEVLVAILLRKIRFNAWPGSPGPLATAITIPASYDQLHRRSVLQSAQMAGFPSVRLVDRSVAAVQSLLIPDDASLPGGFADRSLDLGDAQKEQTVLFVGVSGQSLEVAVMRRDSVRLHQLATAGHWHQGSLPWLHRLVDLAADAFTNQFGFDPRQSSRTAASLQIGCEKAMNSLLLSPTATIKLVAPKSRRLQLVKPGTELSVTVTRSQWLQNCEGLIAGILIAVRKACAQASVSMKDIDISVTMGAILRIGEVRDAVMAGLRSDAVRRTVERADVARGAAACLAAELPGRGDVIGPPRGVTSQAIGIVIEDAKRRRRILPIIPKGTSLPARTNRRLTISANRKSMTLSLVESSGVNGHDWHSLGRYEITAGESSDQQVLTSRMIGFEINVNGCLSVRAQTPGVAASTKLPPLPASTITEESMAEWTKWIASLV